MAAKKRKSNRNNRAGKICISMILVVFAAAMSVQIVKSLSERSSTPESRNSWRCSFRMRRQGRRNFRITSPHTQSQEYVEDIAKSKLGLAYDNEIIFKEEP